MVECLQIVDAWCSQINDVEDQAAKISVEDQSQITSIQTMETDLQSVKSLIKGLNEETESMMHAKSQICTQILDKYKKNASLEADSSKLSQTLELIQQEKVSLSSKLIEKRAYYAKTTEELHAALEEQQAWIANCSGTKARDTKLDQREAIGKGDTMKENASENIHPITDNLETNESYKALMIKFESAKAKLEETTESNYKLVSDCSKMEQSINQLDCAINDFLTLELIQQEVSLSSKLIEKRGYYATTTEELLAALEERQAQREAMGERDTMKENASENSHPITDNLETNESEAPMTKFESAKPKLAEIAECDSEPVSDCSKMEQPINQLGCAMNDSAIVSIQSTETDLKSVKSKIISLKEKTESMLHANNLICTDLDKYKRNASLEAESSKLSQNFGDNVSQGSDEEGSLSSNEDDLENDGDDFTQQENKKFAAGDVYTLEKLMSDSRNIRNVSVIGHVGQGKTSLARMLTDDDIFASTSSTYKSKSTCFLYGCAEKNEEYLITVIDTPGNADHFSDITTALRVTDGSLVVIDVMDGVLSQTENILRKCVEDSVKPVLVLKKIDHLFWESSFSGEEVYVILNNIIEKANHLITLYKDHSLSNAEVNPSNCSVAFCGEDWGFTLATFAGLYKKKFEITEENLWGENFFDSVNNRWTRSASSTCKRGFVQFCYKPIKEVSDACMNRKYKLLRVIMKKLNLNWKYRDNDIPGQVLLKDVMKAWLPPKKPLLDMVVKHIPSPAHAQQYRVDSLYEGPQDNIFVRGIRDCDPNGPLIMYVSNLMSVGNSHFAAYGRVFSGTMKNGTMVMIMGPNYTPPSMKDFSVNWVKSINLLLRNELVAVKSAPCGSIVAVVGVESAILKSATIVSWDAVANVIKPMAFPVSPLIQTVIQCKHPHDRGKLADALIILEKSDPIVRVSRSNSGQYVIHGVGEQHLASCLKILGESFKGEGEFVLSTVGVMLQETIREESEIILKHLCGNQTVRINLRPIEEDLMTEIDAGIFPFGLHENIRLRTGTLIGLYGWDKQLANDICCFGPNILSTSYADKYMQQSVIAAFEMACEQGALGLEMRGICVEVRGEKRHRISHNDIASVTSSVLKGIISAELEGNPVVVELVYTIQVRIPYQESEVVLNILKNCNASDIRSDFEIPISTVFASLPVGEGTQFSKKICLATEGKAFVQCNLSKKWSLVPSNPLVPGTRASLLLTQAH